MTKDVTLSTAGSKERETPLTSSASAAKSGDATNQPNQRDSFEAMLERATPRTSDERDDDDSANRPAHGTAHDHDHGHRHGHESEATYLTPVDLALTWLESRDLTPRSGLESSTGTTPGTTDSPAAVVAHEPSVPTDAAAPDALDPGLETPLPTATLDEQAAAGPKALPTTNGVAAPRIWTASANAPSLPEPGTLLGGPSPAIARKSHVADAGGEFSAAAEVVLRSTDSREAATSLERKSAEHRVVVRTAAPEAGRRSSAENSSSEIADRGRIHSQSPVSGPKSFDQLPARQATPLGAVAATSPLATLPRPDGATPRLLEVAEPTTSELATGGGFVGENPELTTTLTKAQHGADGSYRVTALLNPPSLGRIEATIKVNGTAVEIAITPHTAAGHEALANHLDELYRELAGEHGDVHLSLSDGGGGRHRGNDPTPDALPARPLEEVDAHLGAHAPITDSSVHIIL